MTAGGCVFCKIVSGQIPSLKIFEDGHCIAFLDINPLAEGHVLLIPKVHAETIDELSADQAGAVLKHLPALAKAVRGVTGCEGLNVLQNNGKIAHQAVMHVHFHIIPRSRGDEFGFNWPAGCYEQGKAEKIARQIAENLK